MNKKTTPAKPSQFRISDSFWGRYMDLIREKVLPYQWEALNDRIPDAEPSYVMYNFRAASGSASGQVKGQHKGPVFQDSDFGKWLEAAAYVLSSNKDAELEKNADEAIDIICAAQQPDGYLNSYYILAGLDKRWTNLMDNHELYCLGHLLEGAIAYYEATGKDKFLKAMSSYVDLVYKTFGLGEGKIPGYPGHEEIELALVRLYRLSGDKKHLQLAKYFIDQRGQSPLYFEEEVKKNNNRNYWANGPHKFDYYQAGTPVRKQTGIKGHAVRALYLCSGIADTAMETGDRELSETCERLWESVTERQMYITGSVGSTEYGEAFSYDYDLPNDTIYGETCAAIALVFFARRMLEASTDSKYSDVMERALYNGVLSGMSLDGKSFFYVNPLEVLPLASEMDFFKRHIKPERQKWFGCACCPPNLARLLASIASYAFGRREDGALITHLFIGGEFIHEAGNLKIPVKIETNYPWDGKIKVSFAPEKPVTMDYLFRIPSWCKKYSVRFNGKEITPKIEKGYAGISGDWKKGDTVEINFEMPVRVIEANPAVRENTGKIAVTQGPVVFCLEEADNGKDLHLLSLEPGAEFKTEYKKDLLEGVNVINARGRILKNDWEKGNLYREASPRKYEEKTLRFIPYYAWANRGIGEMRVWINRCFS